MKTSIATVSISGNFSEKPEAIAAGAMSSGATEESNTIIVALKNANYGGWVLAQIVDPAAAAFAHEAGVGATGTVTLGGEVDPGRYAAVTVQAVVALLSDGQAQLETMGMDLEAGPTAVLKFENFIIVVLSHSVSLFDRALYYANSCNPRGFDLVMMKLSHAEFHMYDAWIEKNFNIDAPGATSANITSLSHTICARPTYPPGPAIKFVPKATIFQQGAT